jgi:hypothetical protein
MHRSNASVITSQSERNSHLERDSSKECRKAQVFRKETLINGQPGHLECVQIDGQTYSFARGLVTVISLEEEWFEDVNKPESVIAALTNSKSRPDLFTFWQRLPDTEPKYHYQMEWESISVLPIQNYDHWWSKQIKGATRNMIRKSQKAGVETREAIFDDDFVKGMTDIFNESPVRQGRRFWHYGKDFQTVKHQFSRFLFREALIGAYYQDELIGFVMLANAGRFGVLGQFISKFKHRDKATNNALIAKTVEVCAKKQLPYLTYGTWDQNSLVDFKRHSGFDEVRVPRYFVPLTQKGKLALKLGFQRSWKKALPKQVRDRLKKLRNRWYDLGKRSG